MIIRGVSKAYSYTTNVNGLDILLCTPILDRTVG